MLWQLSRKIVIGSCMKRQMYQLESSRMILKKNKMRSWIQTFKWWTSMDSHTFCLSTVTSAIEGRAKFLMNSLIELCCASLQVFAFSSWMISQLWAYFKLDFTQYSWLVSLLSYTSLSRYFISNMDKVFSIVCLVSISTARQKLITLEIFSKHVSLPLLILWF